MKGVVDACDDTVGNSIDCGIFGRVFGRVRDLVQVEIKVPAGVRFFRITPAVGMSAADVGKVDEELVTWFAEEGVDQWQRIKKL